MHEIFVVLIAPILVGVATSLVDHWLDDDK
ncbi:type I toxin-antitoxin system Fst family toxin [Lacticaseibacillus camelliae]|nr:type I toxin-antitoxin system Fst family toxin [Lacticaseibacillus camelliae]